MSWMNRNPAGLIGLLDAKTSGFVPDTVNREIRPVLELGDHFIAAANRTVKTTNDSSGVYTPFFLAAWRLKVPDGKIWYLQSLGLELRTVGAGAMAGFVVFATDEAQLAGNNWATFAQATSAITAGLEIRPLVSLTFPRPLVLNPGSTFAFLPTQVTNPANLTLWGNAIVTEVLA